MSSLKDRIKTDAELFSLRMQEMTTRQAEQRIASDIEMDAALDERNHRVTKHLRDLVANMLFRLKYDGSDVFEKARLLRDKTFDQTYDDWGPRNTHQRTKELFDDLLVLCRGDKDLLMQLYAAVLNHEYPIKGMSYAWKPRFIKTELGHETVMHIWGRRTHTS